MAEMRASASRVIAAPPKVIYTSVADYATHHQHILPPAYSGYEVEQGGRGQDFRAHVAEPEPGRTLTETDERTGAVTTFRFQPKRSGTLVTIETVSHRDGLQGTIERLIAPRLLGRLYRDELDLLDRYARAQAAERTGQRRS
jgi:hypothetical protein